jgi:group I intron endonuclease
MGCIYRIINKLNGDSYIGQYHKDNPKGRFASHKRLARDETTTQYLYRAIRRHGIENFEFTLICVCSKEELNDLEIKYIAEFKTFGEKGYNMTSGGQGLRDFKHSEETKEKLRKLSTGKFPNEEVRKRISEGLKGHSVSEETREKHRKNATGVPKSAETLRKISEGGKGRVKSKEECENISKGLKGKSKSAEHIKKIKEVKRKLSPEDIKYIRENPDNLSGVQLAEKFNSSRASISRIINNKRYVD